MNKLVRRALTAVAAGGMVLGVSAVPASAGLQAPISITGEAVCNLATGHETYSLNWTITNLIQNLPASTTNTPAAYGDVNIDSATESGAWTGSVTFTPNPVAIGEQSTGSDGPVPNVAGTVVLSVDWSVNSLDQSGTTTAEVTLDGNCVNPTTTTTAAPTTTMSVQAAAVTASPKFTG